MSERRFWNFPTLGELSPSQRGAFYDAIASDIEEEELFGLGDSTFFENPTLRIGLLRPDYAVVSPTDAAQPTISNTKINVSLDRYYVHDMPGYSFDLQIMIAARHRFNDRGEDQEVAHTLAVKGVKKDYVNYLGEPVFRHLSVTEELSLGIMVNFLGDKTTTALLAFMDSDAVKKGVQLIDTYNPVFGAAAGYIRSIAGGLPSAHKNQAITNMNLTFFSKPNLTQVPLVAGTYLLVQPKRNELDLDFSRIRLDSSTGHFFAGEQPLERNHVVLSIVPVS